jgi:mannose-6-phosphate isomerase-like protein (cupin superfamily)
VNTTVTVPDLGRRATVQHRTGTLLMQVNRWDPQSDGPLSEAALQRKLKTLGYDSFPRANPNGVIVSARVHHCERAEAVVTGLVRVTIDDETVILTDGDIAFIPRGAQSRIEPVGSAPVRCIEAIGRAGRV